MATQRDPGAMARRRLQAVRVFKQNLSNSEIARRLGVHRHSVGVWRGKWERHGTAGLASKGPAGPKSRLTPAQEELITQQVLDGAVAAGHPTEVWTLPRIARLIQDECGVKYHPGYVWHLLDRLGFSCQQPSRRAIERNEPLIRRWGRYRWPALKKSPA